MRTAAIYIKTEVKTKEQAQKIAKKLGLSLSAIMNRLLKQFIKTKTVILHTNDEIFNEKTRKALEASEADYTSGRYISFNNKKNLDVYLNSVIKNANRT